jgi:glycosyltransferase involved in cell wall biosynthesis
MSSNKLKVGFLSAISKEWFHLHPDKLEMVNKVEDADYLIYESNGDPVNVIMKLKMIYPREKLVYILSCDQSGHIDDVSIWFTNEVQPSGLSKRQNQIYVTNPAIFKYWDMNREMIEKKMLEDKKWDISFKGTIWSGMRTDMYKYFNDKPGCLVEVNNGYWNWRCNSMIKPGQDEIEKTAFESYEIIRNSKLCLCPKGNGNSSMRILEALACGAIPVLINDFSAPFGVKWEEVGLVFDTSKNTWDDIYMACIMLIGDNEKYEMMRRKGYEFFKNVIYSDNLLDGKNDMKMYNDINTVCYGFSNKIVGKLIEYHKNK